MALAEQLAYGRVTSHTLTVWGCHLSAITKPAIMIGLQQYTGPPHHQISSFMGQVRAASLRIICNNKQNPGQILSSRALHSGKSTSVFSPFEHKCSQKNNDLGGIRLISVYHHLVYLIHHKVKFKMTCMLVPRSSLGYCPINLRTLKNVKTDKTQFEPWRTQKQPPECSWTQKLI